MDRDFLVKQLSEAILAALPQLAAANSLPELVHVLYAERLSTRLDELSSQISPLSMVAPAAAIRTLPPDISFTGRQSHLQQLIQAVTSRVATVDAVGIYSIDGIAGVGKTAFAGHAAHQLAPLFPDGQIFLQLHAHTPGQQICRSCRGAGHSSAGHRDHSATDPCRHPGARVTVARPSFREKGAAGAG